MNECRFEIGVVQKREKRFSNVLYIETEVACEAWFALMKLQMIGILDLILDCFEKLSKFFLYNTISSQSEYYKNF